MNRLSLKYRFGVIFPLVSLLILSTALWANKTPKSPGYAIASAHPLATEAGLNILAHGGNAFDAAVAVSAVLAVVEPYHSGLGGGGFWLLHEAKTKKNIFIDGREVAPLSATKTMFLDKQGNPIKALSLTGGLAAAIPGEPAALVMIAQQFGRLPLKKTLAPAIALAEQGFPVDPQLHYFLIADHKAQQLNQFPATAAIFLKKGKPYRVGERLVQRDLAKTLRLISEQGREGFYRGEVAQRLVSAVNAAGGHWCLEDLASYQVKIRKPLESAYHQLKIITAPLPSAGGIGLAVMLNILAEYPLSSLSKAQGVHYIVEAMRLAFWQRTELLGDSDFVSVPIHSLLSEKNTDFLRSFIHKNKATASTTLPEKVTQKKNSQNTTHFSILDEEGNRVSATLTINYIFGSNVVAAGTGVVLNDEMDDFTIKPNEKNVFGLVGGEHNAIQPGKRPLSSMAPTFLEAPGRIAILGTPGGSRIPTMVLLASLAFDDSLGAISMVSAMRFHHQYLPDWLQFEPETFSPALQKELRDMGYHLVPLHQYYGDMHAITWDQDHAIITAASDPRRIGLAFTVNKNRAQEGYGLVH